MGQDDNRSRGGEGDVKTGGKINKKKTHTHSILIIDVHHIIFNTFPFFFVKSGVLLLGLKSRSYKNIVFTHIHK